MTARGRCTPAARSLGGDAWRPRSLKGRCFRCVELQSLATVHAARDGSPRRPTASCGTCQHAGSKSEATRTAPGGRRRSRPARRRRRGCDGICPLYVCICRRRATGRDWNEAQAGVIWRRPSGVGRVLRDRKAPIHTTRSCEEKIHQEGTRTHTHTHAHTHHADRARTCI